MGHLVFFKQRGHSPIHLVGHFAGTLHDFPRIETDLSHLEAIGLGLAQRLVQFRIAQQGLGGNAPPVEANPAQFFFFDHRGVEAGLCGLDAGHIPAWPRSNHQDVKLIVHEKISRVE